MRLPRVLRENANFRRYYVGQSISLLGDQVSLIALPLTAVLGLHAGAAEMGALTTAYLVPNLLFSLHAGVWLDRRGRRREAMLVADLARGALTATIPIAYALGHLAWAQLYVVAFLLGSLSVVFNVAYGAFFQAVVPRERYVEANALLHGTRGASHLVGTSAGGALVQVLRGPFALAVEAGSFLWSALFLGRIDLEGPPGPPSGHGGLDSGLRWIRDNALIRAELLGVATINLFTSQLRSRVSGAFMLVVRPVGTALGGALGSALGVRPTLWIATVGALAGMLFLVPSPLRTMRDVPEQAPA